MSDVVETYVQRARRLGLEPTEACIACGGNVERARVGGHRFCDRHLDWEPSAVVRCLDCGHEVGLLHGVDE